jgi:F-type H+-transporting ATPase subunit c
MNSVAFTIAVGTIAPALAIGMIGVAGLMGMARNPANSEMIQLSMIIAIAFAEAIAIYVLVVALILQFVG